MLLDQGTTGVRSTTLFKNCCDLKKGAGTRGCCKNCTYSHGWQIRLTARPLSVNVSNLKRVCSFVTAAGGQARDQAQLEQQEGLSTIHEGPEDVPSSNVHHPILGMKSPMQRLRSQGIAAELAYSLTHITATAGPAVSAYPCNISKLHTVLV